jgi:RNase P subunit RPR2
MGEKRKRTTLPATNSRRKRHALPPVRPLTRAAEAFSCRLDQIKEKLTDYLSTDREPEAVLDIAIALTNMENILDITYPSDTSSDSSRVFCSACRKPYTRSNDMHKHVKDQHKRLQPPVTAVFCRDCNMKFEQPRQLVGHEQSDHRATYKSRLEFVWPGFVQTKSEPGELQIFDNAHLILICQSARNSFLQFLRHGDDHAPISTLSVRHNADDPAPSLGSRTSAYSSAQNQISWDVHDPDFQSGFYDDLTSLLLPSAETLGENTQAGIDSDFYNNLHHLLSIETFPIENHSQPSSGDIIR